MNATENSENSEMMEANNLRRNLGRDLVQPSFLPADWPDDFFDDAMNYGDTTHMTQHQKSVEYRRRALYSTLRASAYEKVLLAVRVKARFFQRIVFWFVLVWFLVMLAFNYKSFKNIESLFSSNPTQQLYN